MGFKVRPFEKIVERPEETAAVKVCGSIDDGVFMFSVEGGCWSLPIVECGFDERGTYAILKPCQIELIDGFIIEVEEDVDASDDEGYPASGGKISLVKPGKRSQAQESILLEQALTPDEANLLVPPEALIAVFIGPSGNVNGCACTGLPQELPFRLSASEGKHNIH